MSTSPLLRLYIGQHGQTASGVVSQDDGGAILQSIVGRAPFMLSTEESVNGKTVRTSVLVVVPSQGGLVCSMSPAELIPLDAQGRPIPMQNGKPMASPSGWDDPRKIPVTTFERLPWGVDAPSPAAKP